MLYRTYDPQLGEKMLSLILALKELLLKFDVINKQRFKEDFDNWSPYNIWMDIVISQYINNYIDKLREGISLKKQFPKEFFSYYINYYGVYRLIKEKNLVFDKAFPNKDAEIAFEKLSSEIKKLDELLMLGVGSTVGNELGVLIKYINDGKSREKIDSSYQRNFMLEEHEIYPTYMMLKKPFKTGEKVVFSGSYIPENPYKTFAFYNTHTDDEFFETKISKNNLDKLKSPITQVAGDIEYGLYDINTPYYKSSYEQEDDYSESIWLNGNWYYVQEIPPNTEGIPNNPLRLNDLRYPLKNGETYRTLEQIKLQYGFVYKNSHAMIEQYFQVVNRYEAYYRDYLLKHGVNPDLLKV